MKKELGIYLHIPFCIKKCNYCDFLSFPAENQVKEQYVRALVSELKGYQHMSRDYEVTSVFIGGGTPSVLEGKQIACILEALFETFSVTEDAEITIEANPGTLTEEKLRQYLAGGCNRLSLGLQSAQAEELKRLGRIHSYEEFQASYLMAREAGFFNINVDVMSALPGQTLGSYLDTLKKVLAEKPEHISSYSLIIEPETPFYNKYQEALLRKERGALQTQLPAEEEEQLMYEETEILLNADGYHRYEISNYAKEGYPCRHNIRYWKRGEYLGIGLGASSLIGEVRSKNTAVLKEYLNGSFEREEIIKLSKTERMEEYMFLGLRLMEGVSVKDFENTFAVYMQDVYGKQIKHLGGLGLIHHEGGYLMLTKKGIEVSNYVLSEFLLS